MSNSTTGTRPQGVTPQSVAQLLDALPKTPAGIAIRDQLARLVHEWESIHAGIAAYRAAVTEGYAQLLTFLLEEFARDPSSEHVLQLNARLIQGRQAYRAQLAALGAPPERPAPDRDALAMGALLRQGVATLARSLTAPARSVPAGAPVAATASPAVSVASPAMPAAAPAAPVAAAPAPPQASAEVQRINTSYRQHLERQSEEIDKLHSNLALRLQQSIEKNRQFGEHLRAVLNTLQHADTTVTADKLKQVLTTSVHELIRGHRALDENLFGTRDYLQMVSADNQDLRNELSKVRLLSLTDESTGLPNRRAFLRRLREEMGRAQRYDTPLAIAIIDLDHFKAVNDTYGHAAGDRVLRCYAEQVLTQFRYHDLVARYGGEEFAVLLPSTSAEGALRALAKAKLRVPDVACDFEGRRLTLPTFSAGVTLYASGESAGQLMERADRAMYRAKKLGRNRVEVELPLAPVASPVEDPQPV